MLENLAAAALSVHELGWEPNPFPLNKSLECVVFGQPPRALYTASDFGFRSLLEMFGVGGAAWS